MGKASLSRDMIAAHLAWPSKELLRCADKLSRTSRLPVLDAGCGLGRNSMALALQGFSVVCADSDVASLLSLRHWLDHERLPSGSGHLYPVCADLSALGWPFATNQFSAIVCVHFFKVELLSFFHASLHDGGHLYIETFGGHGGNYLDLPKAGQLRTELSPSFDFRFYHERAVGPADHGAVAVRLLAQKR